MSAVRQDTDPLVALSRAHAALDELAGLDLTGLGEQDLLAYWRDLERLRRRLPSLEHQLVLEGQGRGLPESVQLRGMAQLLRGLLRLNPAEAAGRVRAAEAAGARRTMTGQPVPPLLPVVAGAQAAGSISERHARIIADTLDKLPDAVRDEHGAAIETDLVEWAHRFDPIPLAKLAERVRYCYDPDGSLDDAAEREKHRELSLAQRVDGSAKLSGELTAELAELLLLHFDALATPLPAVDGVKDPRSAAQRRHDALLEALKLNVRARQLPSVGGITATLVLTLTQDAYATGQGLARTGHGALVPASEAVRWAGGDHRLMAVVIDKIRGITGYSSTQRLFTETQRLALQAADGGCTFPQCPVPAHWCQIDHTIDYAHGGPTRIDHGVLACGPHNRLAKHHGWQSARINGRAAWIPPTWIDPHQTPRYNDLHRTEPP